MIATVNLALRFSFFFSVSDFCIVLVISLAILIVMEGRNTRSNSNSNTAITLQDIHNLITSVKTDLKEEIEKFKVSKWDAKKKSENNTYETCPVCYVDYEKGD